MEGLTLENAIELLLAQVKKIEDAEKISLLESVGRIAAKDYFSNFDNPPFNRSPLDGYALKAAETPGNFKIVGEECAGDFFSGEIKTGECLRIMTGAAIPAGCDCVVRQEDVQLDGDNISVPYELKHHQNFCFAGEDVKAGKILVEKNTRLNAKHIAILANQGIAEIEVYRLPKVAIASTGDELLNPNENLSAGKIYNSNLFFLAARLKEFGFEPIILGNLRDDVAAACEKIANTDCDFLITTGGVSVGKKDIMHEVVKNLGEKIFWREMCLPNFPPTPKFFTRTHALNWLTTSTKKVLRAGSFVRNIAAAKFFCRISTSPELFTRRRIVTAWSIFPPELKNFQAATASM